MMNDGLFDITTWPQAGRNQLELALLKGKEEFLTKKVWTLHMEGKHDQTFRWVKVLNQVMNRIEKLEAEKS